MISDDVFTQNYTKVGEVKNINVPIRPKFLPFSPILITLILKKVYKLGDSEKFMVGGGGGVVIIE